MEFENQAIHQFQLIWGGSKTKTATYRQQRHSVLERLYSTLHDMLPTKGDIQQKDWASLLLFVRLVYNATYGSTVEEAQF